ncbi:alanine racemase [Thiohalophilus thiocyanatoxydans]|uniref:Alanine racemase n=1 Tax=Thiohalophilus thiocyanatoxydans TaxID=381308 RepID=A0A4R8IPE6_9GAMM|nr:alanine racemase [Thiohalophilus thiocyanatoxydans]TDY02378.1 alanine racemase [Thiohalophilus thiocyanatoxydans]
MTRATRATLNLRALQHNLTVARRHASDSRLMAIIKANGYGHGMIEVAQALDDADAFGVATLDEAIALREAGIPQSIVLLEGFVREDDLRLIDGFQLQPVIHHPDQIAILEQASGPALDVWLKVDTGMHRLGVAPAEVAATLSRLLGCPRVARVRLMTHLANADDHEDDFTLEQIRRFETLDDLSVTARSIANSAGILGWPQAASDWARPGIMLYGVSPFNNSVGEQHDLRPVMTLRSQLIAVNRHQAGEPIGYGGSWRCPEDMPIGVAAIGYGDGYPRHVPSGTPVLINGKRVPIVGRVSMDMLCVDLRNCPKAAIGDEVILWGEGLPVEEIAEAAGTIGYELLCKVTARVGFDYIHE